ncbi:MAG: CoA transferase [Actinobacteria bacterium]|nr:CoA transferase [Actinomycetota bacterium]
MQRGPLSGVKVVALEQAVAMPYCSFVLSEMGADVVKIERPGAGDVVRGWDSAVRGLSTGFVWVNANKRDLAVDMSTSEGREVVGRLARTADVFLENFAPGVVARLGLADEDLRPDNPGLVYCSLSGYGQTGPWRDTKAYDLLIQGEAGILLTNGAPDAPAKVGIPVTDLIGGSNAAIGVTTALYERTQTGLGRYLDVSMFDSTLLWLGYYPQHQWHTGIEPPRSGMRHQYIAPYGPYLAADGEYVNLVVARPDDWRRFCIEVVERPEWLDDSRFASIADRRNHRDDIERAVEGVIATRPSDEWLQRLAAAGLANGRVRTISEVVSHPQLDARRMVVDAESEVGSLPIIRFPLSDADQPRRIPRLGEHRQEILTEAGYSPAEISELEARGVA